MSGPEIPKILSFWFDDLPANPADRWFGGGPSLDAEIKTSFGSDVERARTAELDHWASTPHGALALCLLLDQFPRNIYRSSSLAFASDAKAVRVASTAIARGFDRQLPLMQQSFFYLPLMHDENLVSQVASCALYEGLLRRAKESEGSVGEWEMKVFEMGPGFAKRHLDAILRFGRYCGRNEALGRKSTPEEWDYLKENSQGF